MVLVIEDGPRPPGLRRPRGVDVRRPAVRGRGRPRGRGAARGPVAREGRHGPGSSRRDDAADTPPQGDAREGAAEAPDAYGEARSEVGLRVARALRRSVHAVAPDASGGAGGGAAGPTLR